MRCPLFRGLTFLLALALSGCATQPLPQDYAGVDTYGIVKQIRCEAREAIQDYAIAYLRSSGLPAEAADLERNGFAGFDKSRLPPDVRKTVLRYNRSAITYDFSFDITETNDAVASARFLETLNRGLFNLDVGAGIKKKRKNVRGFRVSDDMETLVSTVSDNYCQGTAKERNGLYPITGKIGLDELVHTFFDLNQTGNLAPKRGESVPVIADTIEFTTSLSGGLNPTIQLRPVGTGFQLVNAGLDLDATRVDIHQVVIALALPPKDVPKAVAQKTGEMWIDEQLYRKAIQDQRRLDENIRALVE